MYLVKRPESLRAQAIAQIGEAIVTGQLAPGSLHSEQSLAADMSISRTPVREALLHLADNDLVEFVRQRGARVTKLAAEMLGDVFEARMAIESYCVFLLAAQPPKELLAALDAALRREQAAIDANDHPRWVEANMEFHTILVRGMENAQLDKTMANLAGHSMRIGYHMIASKERMCESLAQHRGIFEAIRAGEQDRARSLVINHLYVCTLLVDEMFTDVQAPAPEPPPKKHGP